MIADLAAFSWFGHANRLSKDHVEWRLIDAVAGACAKPTTEPSAAVDIDPWGPPLPPHRPPGSARNIIRQRRSAVAFDGVTSLPAAPFYLMLDRVLPRPDRMPWSTGQDIAADSAFSLGMIAEFTDTQKPILL